MTKKEEQFHERFLELGGVWQIFEKEHAEYLNPLDDLLAETLDSANQIINSIRINQYPKLPEIKIHFINNKEFNAVAGKDEHTEEFYIGIYIGSFFLLDDMFSKMMANKSVMTHVGDITKESDENKILHIDQDFVSKIIEFRNPDSENRARVLDPIRYKFNQMCTGTVLFFLILHECGHILRGHVGYSVNLNKSLFLNEFEKNGENKILFCHRQTLEMDADSFALNRIYNTVKQLIDNNGGSARFKLFNSNCVDAISNYSFAMYSFFRLMGMGSDIFSNKEELSHPPAMYRTAMLMNNLLGLLEQSKYESSELSIFNNAIIGSMQDAERAFLSVTYDETKWDSLKECFSEESRKYVNNILRNWNQVRPLIQMFAYCELPKLKVDMK